MKYLIFSKLNRNHFLFLSYFIIHFIKEINNRQIKQTEDLIHTFQKYFIYTLSDFLSIIPIIIIKLRTKGISKNKSKQNNGNIGQKISEENSKETDAESSNNIEYIYIDMNIENNKKRSKSILKLIILTSIFEFLAQYINVSFDIIVKAVYYINKIPMNSFILFNIIFTYLLSIVILHSRVYRHHYLSLIINIIFLVGLIIYDIFEIKDRSKNYLYILMRIIVAFLYSLEDVYAKILLSFNSISPYLYLLYRGICVNILAFLYSFVFIFVKLPDEKGDNSCVFTRFWKVYDYKLNILFYTIFFFIEYLQHLNIFLIIDKFSMIHLAVANIFGEISTLIFLTIYNKNDNESQGKKIGLFFAKISIYFIIIISVLIYNEFIILNFCGFQKYTKLFLQKVAKNEINQSIINNIDDNDSILQTEMINMERNSIAIFRESDLSENRNSNSKEE